MKNNLSVAVRRAGSGVALVAVLGAAFVVPQAQAWVVTGSDVDAGVSVNTSLSTPNMLSMEMDATRLGSARLQVALEANDGPTLALNGLVNNLSLQGMNQLRLVLDGAVWAAAGDAQGTFGTQAAVMATPSMAIIELNPSEFLQVSFGDWFLGGVAKDFQIDLRSVNTRFGLTVQAVPSLQSVPLPPTWALVSLALVVLGWRRGIAK